MRAHKVGMRSIWWPMSAFGEWFLKARMISETFGKIFFPRSFSLIKNSAETFFSAFEGNFPSDFPLVTMENRVFPFAQFSISQFHIRERIFQDSRNLFAVLVSKAEVVQPEKLQGSLLIAACYPGVGSLSFLFMCSILSQQKYSAISFKHPRS